VLATLTSLRIRNLALVEELVWQTGPGFTAVTGETGSGKSIIVGALNLILGERADKALIRTGAENCAVEAVFSVADAAALNASLEEQGVDPCEAEELIVKRVFSNTGANRQFINGSPTTLSVLKELGDGLVDLHGPHDHQSLLSDAKQLDLLDAFAGSGAIREKYEAQFRALQRLVSEHAELSTSEGAMEREIDLLRHQVREIEAAQLRADEEEELLSRYSVASNSRRLLEVTTRTLARLVEDEDAALPRLGEIGKSLRDLERIDPSASRFTESHLRAQSLQRYAEEMDLDPERLAQIEERVSLFETLKRKYGGTIAEVIAFGEKAADRLRRIESRGEDLARLEKEVEAARKTLRDIGAKLSAKRSTGAPKLASAVTAHLRDLGFKKSEFSVSLTTLEKPAPHGMESVAFLFAPNPGQRRNLAGHARREIRARHPGHDWPACLRRNRRQRRR
jgi:DNA repair protein RecN (Recombination protein N)